MKIAYDGCLYEAQERTKRNNYMDIYSRYEDPETGEYISQPDLYITFTTLPKVGINPKSEWDTPNGIYTYPLDHYIQVRGRVKYEGEDPKYVNIIRATDDVLQLDTMSTTEYEQLFLRLIRLMTGNPNIKEAIFPSDDSESINKNITKFSNAVRLNSKVKGLGGQFWNLTRVVAMMIKHNKVAEILDIFTALHNNYGDNYLQTYTKDINNVWSSVFRSIGTNIISDGGLGIIHSNEPTQTYFRSIKSFEVIDRMPYRSASLLYTDNTTDDELASAIDDNPKLMNYIPIHIRNTKTIGIIDEIGYLHSVKIKNNVKLGEAIWKEVLKLDPLTFGKDIIALFTLMDFGYDGVEKAMSLIGNYIERSNVNQLKAFVLSRVFDRVASRIPSDILCSLDVEKFNIMLNQSLARNAKMQYSDCNAFNRVLAANPLMIIAFEYKSKEMQGSVLDAHIEGIISEVASYNSKEASELGNYLAPIYRMIMNRYTGEARSNIMRQIVSALGDKINHIATDLASMLRSSAKN